MATSTIAFRCKHSTRSKTLSFATRKIPNLSMFFSFRSHLDKGSTEVVVST